MEKYTFSAERQLMFYVSIGGQQRLVKFGSRNENGVSTFTTLLSSTAEAIRKHSLYRRGVITEHMQEEKAADNATKAAVKPIVKSAAPVGPAPVIPSEDTVKADDEDKEEGEVLKAKNFTQAKSMLAKRLNIKFGDIKNPNQLKQLAKENGLTIKYEK